MVKHKDAVLLWAPSRTPQWEANWNITDSQHNKGQTSLKGTNTKEILNKCSQWLCCQEEHILLCE